jgi:hypothetical protein
MDSISCFARVVSYTCKIFTKLDSPDLAISVMRMYNKRHFDMIRSDLLPKIFL